MATADGPRAVAVRAERLDDPPPRRSRVPIVLALLVAFVLVVLCGLFGAYRGIRAAHAGNQAKAALLRGEQELGASKLDETRADLQQAGDGFKRMRKEIRALGPLLPIAKVTPFVRIQVKGAEAFADAGLLLSEAGLQLTKTADSLVNPADKTVSVSNALGKLKELQTSLHAGITLLDTAVARVASLNGYRLVGPIDAARNDLVARLPRIQARADSAESGLAALVAFAGGQGPRRYLFLSQNPAEIRPTGGFIGTYGIVTARDGKLSLERYEAIETWNAAHRQAAIPPDQAGSPFPFISPPFPQNLANINNVPDWPRVGQAAADMWVRGGEEPVDGVLSVSTGFLARLLSVIGPTSIDAYGETVTAANVNDRIDFYVRKPVTGRKDFVAAVAERVFQRLLEAPSAQWQQLGTVVGQAFDAREAMAWSKDADVTSALAARRWDGALPSAKGDFLFDSHFAFTTKNGRGVKRTYDHDVALRADGSGLATTAITINNTEPAGEFNKDTLSFITVYGPVGASLDPSSDAAAVIEPSVSDHPAAAWFRAAPPLGRATLKVAWNVPNLLQRRPDGSWEYHLQWRRIPDHSGDVLHLRIQLPPGWRWLGPAPPETIDLTQDVVGTWVLDGPGA